MRLDGTYAEVFEKFKQAHTEFTATINRIQAHRKNGGPEEMDEKEMIAAQEPAADLWHKLPIIALRNSSVAVGARNFPVLHENRRPGRGNAVRTKQQHTKYQKLFALINSRRTACAGQR